MRQLLDFYKFATDHTASRPDFWSNWSCRLGWDGQQGGLEPLCNLRHMFFLPCGAAGFLSPWVHLQLIFRMGNSRRSVVDVFLPLGGRFWKREQR